MRARCNRGWWAGIVLWSAAACGQELVLPQGKPTNSAGAPSEGFTGASGAPDDAAPRPRLPVAVDPVFTTFGGAGGDTATDEDSAGKPGSDQAAGGGAATAGGGAATAGGGAATAGGFGAGGAVDGTSGSAALLFSEYVEGSGSLKAVEIYAFAASSLDGCELETYFNGNLTPTRLALHGQLEPGDVQVLCSTALATAQPSICNRSTNLTFNGDDALALSCNGALLDVIGQIGVDPGDAWDLGATLDHTLRRRCSVTSGRSDGNQPFEVDAEWLTLGVDTFSDLGKRDCPSP